jgi:hypothetical protein
VADERSVALQVLERIQYDPLLRGQITVEVIAWDEPGADTGSGVGRFVERRWDACTDLVG